MNKNQLKLLSVFWALLLFNTCTMPVVSNDPQEGPYRTEHFVIFNYESELGPTELEQIGMRKEKLLQQINDYLGTNYDKVIEVFITDTLESSHASTVEQIYETLDYVLRDDGHEISHIVAIQEWGTIYRSAIREGIAVAASTHKSGSAFASYKSGFRRSLADAGNSVDTLRNWLEQDIAADQWEGTSAEYSRAGAFIHFLKTQFGIGKVKTWYQVVDTDQDSLAEDTFRAVFDREFMGVINAFIDSLLVEE